AETFFDTGSDQETLVVRPRSLFDNAVPSGTSVAIELLLRLALHTGVDAYERRALAALRPMADGMARYPTGFGRYLGALDFHLGPVAEIALVWPAAGSADGPLLDPVSAPSLPKLLSPGPPAFRAWKASARRRGRARRTCAGDMSARRQRRTRKPSDGSLTVGYNPASDAGGGFLRTGCGPGPLEPDLDNPSEGNATRPGRFDRARRGAGVCVCGRAGH